MATATQCSNIKQMYFILQSVYSGIGWMLDMMDVDEDLPEGKADQQAGVDAG